MVNDDINVRECKNLFDELFTYEESEKGIPIIGPKEWGMVLIPHGTSMGKEMFECLSRTCEFFQSSSLFVVEGASTFNHIKYREVSWSYEEYQKSVMDYGAFDAAIFDHTARWAALLKGVTVGYLAADMEFFSVFFNNYGGLPKFKGYIKEFLIIEPYIAMPDFPHIYHSKE